MAVFDSSRRPKYAGFDEFPFRWIFFVRFVQAMRCTSQTTYGCQPKNREILPPKMDGLKSWFQTLFPTWDDLGVFP